MCRALALTWLRPITCVTARSWLLAPPTPTRLIAGDELTLGFRLADGHGNPTERGDAPIEVEVLPHGEGSGRSTPPTACEVRGVTHGDYCGIAQLRLCGAGEHEVSTWVAPYRLASVTSNRCHCATVNREPPPAATAAAVGCMPSSPVAHCRPHLPSRAPWVHERDLRCLRHLRHLRHLHQVRQLR